MGENCTCGSRLIVHRSVRDELLERIVAKTADWTVGDPQDPATKIGPMIEAAAPATRCSATSRPGARRARASWSVAIARCPRQRRLLRRADGLRWRRQLDEDRARGDLRAGHLDDRVRLRGRGPRARQRHQLRPRTPRSTPTTSTRRSVPRARCVPGRSRSTPTPRATSRRRSAASRSRASAAATRASRRSTSTPRRRRSGSRSRPEGATELYASPPYWVALGAGWVALGARRVALGAGWFDLTATEPLGPGLALAPVLTPFAMASLVRLANISTLPSTTRARPIWPAS